MQQVQSALETTERMQGLPQQTWMESAEAWAIFSLRTYKGKTLKAALRVSAAMADFDARFKDDD